MSTNKEHEIPSLVLSKNFKDLDYNIQAKTIESLENINKAHIENGFMTKLLGAKMPNMAVYSAFILCCILLVFIIVIAIFSCKARESFIMDLVKLIIPVITMSLGYMFGKSDSNNNEQ